MLYSLFILSYGTIELPMIIYIIIPKDRNLTACRVVGIQGSCATKKKNGMCFGNNSQKRRNKNPECNAIIIYQRAFSLLKKKGIIVLVLCARSLYSFCVLFIGADAANFARKQGSRWQNDVLYEKLVARCGYFVKKQD
jgi:hypothetical protein